MLCRFKGKGAFFAQVFPFPPTPETFLGENEVQDIHLRYNTNYMAIYNKRAKFDYSFEEGKLEAGIVLSGGEAKAVRTGHADLSRSVGKVLSGEVYLVNANIPVVGTKNYVSTRTRKLLLHKNEIVRISTQMKQRKLTLVPIKMYNRTRLIKLELALGKPKRKFEKKEAIKRKDIQRDIEKEFRGRP